MHWIWWLFVGLLAANIALFGALYLWYLYDEKDRRKRK